ncbi:MAG: hypothetical protein ACI4UV_10260 [Victivallales bacterium]
MFRTIFLVVLFTAAVSASGGEIIDFSSSVLPLKFQTGGKHSPVKGADGTPMRSFRSKKAYCEIRLKDGGNYQQAPFFEIELKLEVPDKEAVKVIALHVEDAEGELAVFNKEIKHLPQGVGSLIWQFGPDVPKWHFSSKRLAKNKKLDFPIKIRGLGILFDVSNPERQPEILLGKMTMLQGNEETANFYRSIFPTLHFPDMLHCRKPSVKNAELLQRERDVLLRLSAGTSELAVPQEHGMRSLHSGLEKIRVHLDCDKEGVTAAPWLLTEKRIRIPLPEQHLQKGSGIHVFEIPEMVQKTGKLKLGGLCFRSGGASVAIKEIELRYPQPLLRGIKVKKTPQKLGLILPETKNRRASIGFRNLTEETFPLELRLVLRDHEKELRKEMHSIQLEPGGEKRFPMPEMKKEGIYYIHYSMQVPGRPDIRKGKTSFAVMTPSGAAAPEDNPFWFGIQTHAQRFSPQEQALIAEAYQLSGIRLNRNGAQWTSIQPEKGVWDFSEVEGRIGRFRERGVAYIGSLSSCPKWAVRKDWIPYKAKHEVAFPHRWPGGAPPDHDAFREYARRLTEHFPKGTFPFYEMQNEPELVHFANFSPEELAELQKIAAAEIRKADPGAKIMTAGFTGVIPRNIFLEPDYMERTLKACRGFFDVIAIHCHGSFNAYVPEVEYLLNMRKRLGIEHIPWIPGETGITSVTVSELEQGETLFKKLIYSWANGAIGYLWYDFKNDGRNPVEGEHNFGIYTYDLEPKAGYPVYNALTRLLKRANFRRDLSDEDVFLYGFSDRERNYHTVWSRIDSCDHLYWLLDAGTNVEVSDLFGNRKKAERFHGASLIQIGRTPATVITENRNPCRFVPFLRDPEIRSGRNGETLEFVLRNPLPVPIRGTVAPAAGFAESLRSASFEIPPGGKRAVALSLAIPGNHLSGTMGLTFSLEGMEERRSVNLFITPRSDIPRTADFRVKPDLRIDKASQMKRLTVNAPGEHQLWRGADDLSAQVFLNHSVDDFKLRIMVRDDIHSQPYRGKDAWRGDSIQICLNLPGGKQFREIGLTHLPDGTSEVFDWSIPPVRRSPHPVRLKTSRNEAEKLTVYEATIPWMYLELNGPPERLRFNVLVNENDGAGRKLQGALSFPAKDVSSFHILHFLAEREKSPVPQGGSPSKE